MGYLFRRPPGKTVHGGVHCGGWAFLPFDAEVCVRWNAQSSVAPPRVVSLGSLVCAGRQQGVEAAPCAAVPQRVVRRDRWAELRAVSARGWVPVLTFVEKFGLVGRGDSKHAVGRASKRLRDEGHVVKDAPQGVGRPRKTARVCDLQRSCAHLA